MSRKDYVAAATILAAARKEADSDSEHGYGRHLALDSVTYDLADLFHRDNDRFDSARFFTAADLRDVKVPA